jgi:hypothetical protein
VPYCGIFEIVGEWAFCHVNLLDTQANFSNNINEFLRKISWDTAIGN